MNGVGVLLACTSQAVFLTNPAPDGNGAPSLLRWDGEEWAEQSFGTDRMVPHEVASAPDGLFLRAFRLGEPYATYLVTPDGSLVEDASLTNDLIALDPSTGKAVAIGPDPGLVGTIAPDEPPGDLAAPRIRQVALP